MLQRHRAARAGIRPTVTLTCRSTRGNNGCWPPGESSLVDTRSHDRQLASDWSRIKGAPAEENFRLQEEDVPELRKGEILCRALYISVDPITRCMSTAATIYVCIMHIINKTIKNICNGQYLAKNIA